MKPLFNYIKFCLFILIGISGNSGLRAQCVTPVITSIGNSSPLCEGGTLTLNASGTVGGVSSGFVRMAGIGGNAGHRAFDQVFSSGDRPGSIARLSNAQFDAIFAGQPNDAAKASALKGQYDVLMFTWASPDDPNITWGLITAYLATGGSVFFDGDYANVDNLYDGTSASLLGIGDATTGGCNYTLVSPAPFAVLVANGVTGCFANDHLSVTSFPSWMQAYIKVGSKNLAVAGIYPLGNQGRLIVQGPDQDYHANRNGGAGSIERNQYQMILNQMDFLTANQAGFTWTGPNGFTSNEANPSIPNITPAHAGVYTAKLTNTTGGGCFTTATTTVIVNALPTISCSNVSASCPGVVNYSPVITGEPTSITYNLSGATTGSGSGTGSGNSFNSGVTNVTITASNACGTRSCSFTVTVNDTEPPVIVGENTNITMNFNAGSGAPLSYTEAGITFLSLYTSGPHVHLGDWSGDGSPDIMNHSGCCSTPYRLTVGAGVQFTLVSMDVKQVTSPTTFYVHPSGASVTISSPGLYTFPAGFVNVTEVRWNQPSGQSVIDDLIVSTKTANACPKDIIKANDPGQCGAVVSFNATATDNCAAIVTYSHAPGSLFPIGTTPVTVTATDPSGNSTTCSFNVVVNDIEKPVISTNGNQSVNNDAGVCGAAVPVSATATDNCSVGIPTGVRSDALALTDPYPVGTTTITWNVTDVNSNPAVAEIQTITVTDNEAPVITHNGDQNVMNDPGACSANVPTSASATDNCSVGSPTGVRSDGQPLSNPYSVGTTTITWNVTDVNGNPAVAEIQTIIVTDNVAPVITHSGNKSVMNDPGTCNAAVPVSATATDNCSVGIPTGVRSDALALTDPYPVGTTTITWNVTDANGNPATTVTQTVTVTDNESPILTCANMVINPTSLNGAVVNYPPPAGNDNCPGSSITMVTTGTQSGANFPIGMTPVTYSITDASGNTTTCTFTVTVRNPYTTDKKVNVCHNGNVISISTNALQAHLNHGDQLGLCEWYTSTITKTSANSLLEVVESSGRGAAVYPNPTSGLINIQLPNLKSQKAEIVITSSNGKVVDRRAVKAIGQTERFDLRRNGAGMYFIKIISEAEEQNLKVIVQR